MEDLDEQMTSLDDFVTRARSQNAEHHDQHAASLTTLSDTVESSYAKVGSHFKDTFARVENLRSSMDQATTEARDALEPLAGDLCQPLAELRDEVNATSLQEYQPTGDTPRKMIYDYPTDMPHTKPHTKLVDELNGVPSPSKMMSKGAIFADADPDLKENRSPTRAHSTGGSIFPLTDRNTLSMSLREVHPNVNSSTTSLLVDPQANTANTIHGFSVSIGPGTLAMTDAADNTMPLFKKSRTTKLPRGDKKVPTTTADGRENMPPMQVVGGAHRAGEVFAQSVTRRKSPRLN
jgi:kinesin family member 11